MSPLTLSGQRTRTPAEVRNPVSFSEGCISRLASPVWAATASMSTSWLVTVDGSGTRRMPRTSRYNESPAATVKRCTVVVGGYTGSPAAFSTATVSTFRRVAAVPMEECGVSRMTTLVRISEAGSPDVSTARTPEPRIGPNSLRTLVVPIGLSITPLMMIAGPSTAGATAACVPRISISVGATSRRMVKSKVTVGPWRSTIGWAELSTLMSLTCIGSAEALLSRTLDSVSRKVQVPLAPGEVLAMVGESKKTVPGPGLVMLFTTMVSPTTGPLVCWVGPTVTLTASVMVPSASTTRRGERPERMRTSESNTTR